MGSLTNYAETQAVGHLTLSAYTPAATIYLALCTADPTDAATGASMNEVANSGSYARTAITFGAAATRRVTQNADVDFPTATGSWGTVTHWAIVDNNTYGAGNVLAYGAFGASKAIVSGNSPTVASGEVYVDITASTGFSNYYANGFLDRMFRNQALTISANYVGWTTAAVSDANTGSTITEPAAGSYARVQVNASGGGSPAWNAASAGAVDNANDISFPTATASQGTMADLVVCDALSAGNLLCYGSTTAQAVGDGDTVTIAAGDFDISQS